MPVQKPNYPLVQFQVTLGYIQLLYSWSIGGGCEQGDNRLRRDQCDREIGQRRLSAFPGKKEKDKKRELRGYKEKYGSEKDLEKVKQGKDRKGNISVLPNPIHSPLEK